MADIDRAIHKFFQNITQEYDVQEMIAKYQALRTRNAGLDEAHISRGAEKRVFYGTVKRRNRRADDKDCFLRIQLSAGAAAYLAQNTSTPVPTRDVNEDYSGDSSEGEDWTFDQLLPVQMGEEAAAMDQVRDDGDDDYIDYIIDQAWALREEFGFLLKDYGGGGWDRDPKECRHFWTRLKENKKVYDELKGLKLAVEDNVVLHTEVVGCVWVSDLVCLKTFTDAMKDAKDLNAKYRELERVARIIDEFHKLQITHGDIKGDNIMLCGDEWRLIDFEDADVWKEHNAK